MIYPTQLVYVREGYRERFCEFEDRVLPLLAKHGGELLLSLRPASDAKVAGTAEVPYELHLIRFEREEDLARYSNDDERRLYLPLKDESVRDTLLVKGNRV